MRGLANISRSTNVTLSTVADVFVFTPAGVSSRGTYTLTNNSGTYVSQYGTASSSILGKGSDLGLVGEYKDYDIRSMITGPDFTSYSQFLIKGYRGDGTGVVKDNTTRAGGFLILWDRSSHYGFRISINDSSNGSGIITGCDEFSSPRLYGGSDANVIGIEGNRLFHVDSSTTKPYGYELMIYAYKNPMIILDEDITQ